MKKIKRYISLIGFITFVLCNIGIYLPTEFIPRIVFIIGYYTSVFIVVETIPSVAEYMNNRFLEKQKIIRKRERDHHLYCKEIDKYLTEQ